MQPQRISILGPPGSGKSTLARLLSEKTGIPVMYIDAHYFNPGWEVKSLEERCRITEEFAAQPRWIIEGLWTSTMHLRLPVSDIIVFLDMPGYVCFPRVVKRLIANYGKVRPDAAPGCPERWDWEFIKFAWRNKHQRQRIMSQIVLHGNGTQLIILKNVLEVKMFVEEVERGYN